MRSFVESSAGEILCLSETWFKSLKASKVGKAPGDDQISNEFFKNLPDNWILYLTSLFNKIFSEECFPESWADVLMCMLYKKGDKSDPGNYREIALINCIVKIFTSILKVRLDTWALKHKIIPECQAGFVIDKRCLDNIFTLTGAINQQLRLGNRKVLALFIDLKRAFDSVSHFKLWCCLYDLGVSAKIIRVLKGRPR